jgi:hypothetical protein
VPIEAPVVELMLKLMGTFGSTEAAVQFINQQVNSKSSNGGPNLGAAAAAIAAVAAGKAVTPGLAGPAGAASAAADSACAMPVNGSQVVV